ncbi:MAG TPA: MlaD family protein [Bryobacteraceae bacterium]|jgi:phospholipid/cholesterol/gamma-HCH transport system substrate-binding protein|nr:MlaD family protein [Bryobacteraceae bacterium]
MAAVAMAILGVLIFLLTGSGDIFTTYATLYTYMEDSAAMATSTPVRLNGITIGKIDRIEFSGLKEKGKVVVIRMKVKERMLDQIPDDSVAGVDAANLLGDKFINITKGRSPRHVQNGGTLNSLQGQDIPELMSRAGDVLGSFQAMTKRFDLLLADIEAGRGNVGKFIRDEQLYNQLSATAGEMNKLVAAVNSGKGTLGRLLRDEELYEDIRSPVRRLDALLNDLQEGRGTAGKFLKDPALFDETRQTIADIRRLVDVDFRKLVDDLNAGRGTAGKLLKDEQLYRNINTVVDKLNNSIDRINSGQGTLGQLMVNNQLYESLNGATREAQSLIKDMRANPKKFLRIKLALF